MELLQHLLPLLFPGSLFLLDLSLGLDATREDLFFMWRHPVLLLRAFLAISVVVPIAAVIAVSFLPLHPLAKAGVILMAVAPVPPLVPGKDMKLGGRKGYVYGLYAAFVPLTVVIVPMTLAILNAIYHKAVDPSAGAIARTVGVSVFLPLAIGLAVQAMAPKLAARAAPLLSTLSMVILVVACVPLFIKAWPAIEATIGDGSVVAINIIVVLALAAGHLLGGPDPRDRVALAGAAATRHPGIAMLLANANFADKGVTAVILLFLVVSVFLGAIYKAWVTRAQHGHMGHPAPTT